MTREEIALATTYSFAHVDAAVAHLREELKISDEDACERVGRLAPACMRARVSLFWALTVGLDIVKPSRVGDKIG